MALSNKASADDSKENADGVSEYFSVPSDDGASTYSCEKMTCYSNVVDCDVTVTSDSYFSTAFLEINSGMPSTGHSAHRSCRSLCGRQTHRSCLRNESCSSTFWCRLRNHQHQCLEIYWWLTIRSTNSLVVPAAYYLRLL